MDDPVEVHVIFQGRVQGVGFRATVRHLALQLGVQGTVRNRSDGSVEMYAQGSKDTLEKLIDNIKAEFGSAYIQSAIPIYSTQSSPFEGFNIVR